MGYGIIAFSAMGVEFSPVAALSGIYAAIVAGFFASMLGGTPTQITGPMISLTLVLSTLVTSLVSNPAIESSPTVILGLVSLCVLIAGVIQVFFGFLGLANLVKYVPQPVVSGFINGLALLVLIKQIYPILGIDNNTPLFDIVRQPMSINSVTTVVGFITIMSIYFSERYVKHIPSNLMALIFGTTSYYLLIPFFPESQSSQVVGTLQLHIPTPDTFLTIYNQLINIPIKSILPQLFITGFVISLIGSIESMLSAVVSDNLARNRHNSKKTLIGQGIGNIASSLFGSIASAGSIVRSTANYKAGGRTRLSGILCSVFIFLIILLFGTHAGKIPFAVFGGIIFVIGLKMFDKWTLNIIKKSFFSFSCPKEARIDIIINLFVAMITISINLIAAVGVGMLVASALFISKIGRSVIKRHYFADNFHSRKMRPNEHMELVKEKGRKISILQLQGPIFFGSAEHLAEKIQSTTQQSMIIILDFKHVSEIDSTGAAILLRIEQNIVQEKKYILYANFQNNIPVWSYMVTMNFAAKLNNDNFFTDTDAALEWAEDNLLNKHQFQQGIMSEFNLDVVGLFENFTDDELSVIQKILIHQVYIKGDTVFSENDKSRDLYILTKGLMTVTIYLPERDLNKRLFTYSPGIIFGEMSFLDGNPRSANVKAHDDSEVFCLPYAEYMLLCKQRPEMANKLLKNIALEISHRLRRTSSQVRELEDN